MAQNAQETSFESKTESPAEADVQIISPTRHVGRTLEAEGIFADVLGTALPVGEESGQNSIDTVDVRTFEEDTAYQQAAGSEDDQVEQGKNPEDGTDDLPSTAELFDDTAGPFSATSGEMPEALRTRLPGDTSSDPHTDLGPENASTAHATIDKEAGDAETR